MPNKGRADIKDYECVCIVAGSRKYTDYREFSHYMDLVINEWFQNGKVLFVSGVAMGPDSMIITYCQEKHYDWVEFPADWSNIEGVPEHLIGVNAAGKKYNKIAGHQRNDEMGKIATHLVLFYDGKSKGSTDMLKRADKLGLKKYVLIVHC